MQQQQTDTKAPRNGTPARSAPGPRSAPIVGNVLDIRRSGGLIQFYVDAHRQYGDIVRFQMGPLATHLIVHPDYVRQVLVTNRQNYWKGIGMRKVKLVLGDGLFTSEGALWQRQRRLLQPTFTPRSVTQFAAPMTRVIERMLERWEAAAARGEAIEINQEMMRMAMGVIAATMFNIDITEEAVGAAGAFTHVLDYITANTMRFVDLPLWVPTPGHRRFNDATRTLNQFMGGIIRARREAQARGDGPRHNDLLDMLINAKDEETGQSMSDKQIYDEVLTIFFAGHETTAQALTWTWHLLSQHPDAESRLHAEVDAALGGRTATADDLASLPYPRQVIDEAMRLYPPVWIFVRDAYGDDELGGYTVPAKSMIMLSPYLTHRHPGFWEEPDQFDPERFAPERAEKRHHYAYFPFGGGARTCIGNSFALLEAHLAVAMIAQRFRLRRADDRPVAPKMLGTLRPDGPVMMRLEPRQA